MQCKNIYILDLSLKNWYLYLIKYQSPVSGLVCNSWIAKDGADRLTLRRDILSLSLSLSCSRSLFRSLWGFLLLSLCVKQIYLVRTPLGLIQ